MRIILEVCPRVTREGGADRLPGISLLPPTCAHMALWSSSLWIWWSLCEVIMMIIIWQFGIQNYFDHYIWVLSIGWILYIPLAYRLLVSYPTQWSLYSSLDFCVDHLRSSEQRNIVQLCTNIQHDIPSEKHYTYYRNCVFFWYADDNSCVSSLKSLGKFPLPPTWILTALPPFSLPLFYDLVWIKGRPPSYWLKIVGPSTFRLILEPNIWGSSRCTVYCL